MREDLISRLVNLKFQQAMNFIDGEKEHVKDIVKSLSNLFGNVGASISGEVGDLIRSTVYCLVEYVLNGEENK